LFGSRAGYLSFEESKLSDNIVSFHY